MFVSAVVSEIRELKKEKEKGKEKNFEIDYFQFNTFPGHLIYPFFNQSQTRAIPIYTVLPYCVIQLEPEGKLGCLYNNFTSDA